jgi:hypothetical protein
MLTPAHPCSPMLTHAHPCSPMLTHAHPCSPMLTHAHPCSPMLTHAHLLSLQREKGSRRSRIDPFNGYAEYVAGIATLWNGAAARSDAGVCVIGVIFVPFAVFRLVSQRFCCIVTSILFFSLCNCNPMNNFLFLSFLNYLQCRSNQPWPATSPSQQDVGISPCECTVLR